MAAIGPGTVAAVLVAGGSGQRLGAEVPKAFVHVGGATLLEHAAARFAGHPDLGPVVVVAPRTHLDHAADLVPLPAVAGGATRQESVAAGLAYLDTLDDTLDEPVEFVLVHDVARPFTPDAVIAAVVEALRSGADAAVPVVPIHDTVRRVDAEGRLAGVVDRTTLVAIQTPQGFRRAVLVAAHAAATDTATDDAALVEAQGGRVVAVPGADEGFKVTTPLDLARAEAVVRLLSAPSPSVPGGIP